MKGRETETEKSKEKRGVRGARRGGWEEEEEGARGLCCSWRGAGWPRPCPALRGQGTVVLRDKNSPFCFFLPFAACTALLQQSMPSPSCHPATRPAHPRACSPGDSPSFPCWPQLWLWLAPAPALCPRLHRASLTCADRSASAAPSHRGSRSRAAPPRRT